MDVQWVGFYFYRPAANFYSVIPITSCRLIVLTDIDQFVSSRNIFSQLTRMNLGCTSVTLL
jgi:hypothetical protein